MNIIKGVFDLAEVALATEPYHVTIDNEKIEELGKKMLEEGPFSFGSESEQKYKAGIILEIIKEIVAGSINYCYWYGSHNIRPNGCSSTMMYEDVDKAFGNGNRALIFELRIRNLIKIISEHRYPLLEERKKHLSNLVKERKTEEFSELIYEKNIPDEELFNKMVSEFPGYSSDMFLKRTSLFFIQLYRRFGWYKDTLMKNLFMPTDYQVPKILNYFGCIKYSDELLYNIKNSILIPKHSLMEVQIRAATIKACKMLQDITKWNVADIDTFLWCNRKMTTEPFHLTITTDY